MLRILLSCLFTLLLIACAARPVLNREETTLVAWWIEDSCRGVARSPGELQTEDASQGLQRIAEAIATRGTSDALSRRLAARRSRWPVLLHFLSTGIMLPAEDGLVTVAPTATGEEVSLAHSVAKEENNDRLTVEVVLLSKAQEDADGSRRLRAAMREARGAADRQRAREAAPAKAVKEKL